MKLSLSLVLLSGLISKANAVQCGTPLTTDCVADSDIRYDKEYSNDLIKQSPFWEHWEGLWRAECTTRDAEGNVISGAPYDEKTGTYGMGTPTNFDGQRAYSNITMVGSRLYQHSYIVTPPVPQETCQLFPASEVDETCGVNGRIVLGEMYGTTTYEKDGTAHLFKGNGWFNQVVSTRHTPIDEVTLMMAVRDSVEGTASEVQWLGSQLFYDNFTKAATSGGLFQSSEEQPYQSQSVCVVERIDGEDQFLKEVEEAMAEYNIVASKRASIPLPMTTECFSVSECPTEEEFCTTGKDPSCSVSPYQEPPASLNGGGIALIVILSIAAVISACYIIYTRVAAAQKNRYKEHFIRGIARNITIASSAGMLSPDQLQKEFDHIDKDGGGTISKKELQDFIADGKLGDICDKDFDAMWLALDDDDSGEVDFVEFAVFLSSCGKEFDKVNKEQQAMTKEDKLKYASKRLSVRQIKDPEE
eukprot:CAMPEP_0172307012 /NCGR_PEP_ID=MMETSP1058-20130122/7953_1 /TAXON_ID=83371 /ORGANISM="Detonula confervacea, Strain CCMP 353" /LENGTH=472 /DNA_ID=CAMNT_0013019071 /DNA_START=72 /DNA_END=1490 /DNA_ORIENTATION=+